MRASVCYDQPAELQEPGSRYHSALVGAGAEEGAEGRRGLQGREWGVDEVVGLY